MFLRFYDFILFNVFCKITNTQLRTKGENMIISCLNQKGGVGKTTISVNLAASLTRTGARVLLIDADPAASGQGLPQGLRRFPRLVS
jgi:Mrp family chromosome partitioning ATPase